jgi:putative N-acetylmannosamine-6-phosphate epimerase
MDLDVLRRQLVVSCQPVTGGPMDRPDIVAAFALAAIDGGARGLRIEGVDNLRAVRVVTKVPVIGLVKCDLTDSPVRITPLIEQVDALIAAGADIVAFDATDRPRPVPREAIVARIHDGGALAMADCASAADGRAAAAMGCDVLGSTMSGYTEGPVPEGPDLAILPELARLGRFVMAEGRYQVPADAAAALAAGADAVVAGSAITRPELVTAWFVAAMRDAGGRG